MLGEGVRQRLQLSREEELRREGVGVLEAGELRPGGGIRGDQTVRHGVAEHSVGRDEGVLHRAGVQGLPAPRRGRRGQRSDPPLYVLAR